MSTSIALVTCARRVERAAHVLGDPAAHRAHRLERLADLRWRRSRCRSRRRRRVPVRAAGAAGAARRRLGPEVRRGAVRRRRCAGPPPSMKARMSFFVTRPPRPVPWTWPGSTPCSAAMRATTGETKLLPLPLACRPRLARVSDAAAGAGVASSTVSAVGVVAGESLRRSTRAAACAVAGSGTSPSLVGRRRDLGALGRDHRELRADLDRLALLDEDLGDHARRRRRHLGVDLVGRDLEQALVGLDVLAHLLEPLRDRPLGDGHAHLGHHDVGCACDCHQYSDELLQPFDDVFDLRDERLLERRRERHGRVGRRDPLHGRVEVLERLLGDRRRDLGAEAAGARVLVQHEHLRRLPRRLEHRLLVPRA